MKRILVIGSSNTDMIVNVPRIPKPGETILGGRFLLAAGGKGANQAVAAARSGGNVTFVSKVGKDSFGKQSLEGYRLDGINTEYILIDENESTGVALIYVSEDGENSIAVASGANMKITPEDIQNISELIEQNDFLLMQLEIPLETVKAAAKIANHLNKKIILNPAPAQYLDDELLKCISIITPNETEAEILTGKNIKSDNDISDAAEFLMAKGIDTVIITLGAKGIFLATKDIREFITSFKVDAVDTTAAGDVFNGALVTALAEDKSLIEAAIFGNAASALSVTKSGAQPSIPLRKDVEHFLRLSTKV
ncbi:MAG: ribokinase [Ignavibacteriales bacterium]|nr:MAG: ribokinase [Ignavibacteriales bacterium]